MYTPEGDNLSYGDDPGNLVVLERVKHRFGDQVHLSDALYLLEKDYSCVADLAK